MTTPADHPRVSGEHDIIIAKHRGGAGSSPRERGARCSWVNL